MNKKTLITLFLYKQHGKSILFDILRIGGYRSSVFTARVVSLIDRIYYTYELKITKSEIIYEAHCSPIGNCVEIKRGKESIMNEGEN